MRVLHVVPSLSVGYGGPTASLLGYCRAGSELGIDVEVASPRPGELDVRAAQETAGRTTFHFFPSVGSGSTVLSPKLWRWLRSRAKSVDVVHVHGLFNPVSSIAARLAVSSAPTIIRPFGTLSRYTFSHRRSWQKRLYFNALDGRNVSAASGLHFTSDAESDEAARLPEVRRQQRFVIPPPLTGLGQAGKVNDRDTVLYLSRLHPVKRVELLLHAWKTVVQRLPEARLVIAGDGAAEYVASLKMLATELGVSDSLRFVGHANRELKTELLHRAMLFVLPSAHENFGVAVLEALAEGVPAVVTPQVALSSFVQDHRLGLVAEPTANALAWAIESALGDRDLRLRCNRTGPGLIATTFSLERVASALDAMYQTVTSRPN